MTESEKLPCGKDCASLLGKLEAYLDGALNAAEQRDLERHLAECFPCADRASIAQQLRMLIKTSCVERAPDTLRARILRYVHEDSGA